MIDTSIYGMAGKVKSVADFDREALLADAAKQQQQLTALQVLQGRQKADEYSRGVQRAEAFRQLAGRWNADTSDDQRIVDLKNAGFADEADKLQTGLLKRKETEARVTTEQAQARKAQLDNAAAQLSMLQNVISAAKDQASYTQGKAALAQAGLDVSQVPDQYDPAYVAAAGQQALTMLQRLQEERAKLQQAEVARHNQATEGLTKRGQDVTAATTRRGQDLADARSKESNAIQRDLTIQQKQLAVDKAKDESEARDRKKDAAIASITDRVSAIDKALDHPGRKTATGLSSVMDPRNIIPGTDARNFKALADQISGAAFLEAFESLKGGGAITEIEGKKAEQAVARLDRAQSDEEYEAALNDLRGIMATGYKRMTGKDLAPRAKAGPKAGDVQQGYRFKGGNPADPKNWEKQ